MKINNKGFAISVILYSMVILVMGVMFLLIDIVNTRYRLSKDTKDNIVDFINEQGVNTISDELASKIATNKVISTNQLVLKNENFYYYGTDPDNYVTFNGESWRIIGVFNVNGIRHLKLVCTNYVNSMTSDNNHLIESNVFEYLNHDYYETIGPDRSMIQIFNWYNSEYSTNRKADSAYLEEEKTTSFSNNYVGLISGSDFGYAAASTFLSNNLSEYASSINDNWLSLTYNYFTMSFNGSNINIVSDTGNLVSTDNLFAYIYPSIYLKKNILITGGTGTVFDPYILSLG